MSDQQRAVVSIDDGNKTDPVVGELHLGDHGVASAKCLDDFKAIRVER